MSALFLQLGSMGLFCCLLLQSVWVLASIALIGVGIFAFFKQVRWMLQHRKPAPTQAPRPDLGVWQAMQSMVYLAIAALLGVALVGMPDGEWKAEARLVYGILGLLGFLTQIIVGVSARLLPLFAWLWGFAANDYAEKPIPPQQMVRRPLQVAVFGLWTLAVPLMAYAAVSQAHGLLRVAAGMLLLAVVLGAWMNVGILRHSMPR